MIMRRTDNMDIGLSDLPNEDELQKGPDGEAIDA